MSFWKNIFFKAQEEKPMRHIALVFPATFPSLSLHVPEPNAHCTIMYLGTSDTVDFTPEDVINGLKGLPLDHMLFAKVTVPEMFGPDKDVPVLRIAHNMLDYTNEKVAEKLAAVGITDPSEYADEYKPHVTVSQTTWDDPPAHVLLTHAELWWAGKRLSLEVS